MSGARALVAAVPQRVWTAVAGLVLLASVGVALVLGAGLSTWQGGVTHAPVQGASQPPGTGVAPPGSAVVVVPTPHGRAGHVPSAGHGPSTVAVAVGVAPVPAAPAVAPVAPAAVAPPAAVPTATTTTASPRTAATSSLPHTGPGRAVGKSKHNAAKHGPHGNRGKHLGWTKGERKGAAHGHARTHDR